jgi:HSP20 family molecular chaperone IbpA
LVDEKSAEAKFEDGTLEVTVRKVDSKGSKVNVG